MGGLKTAKNSPRKTKERVGGKSKQCRNVWKGRAGDEDARRTSVARLDVWRGGMGDGEEAWVMERRHG